MTKFVLSAKRRVVVYQTATIEVEADTREDAMILAARMLHDGERGDLTGVGWTDQEWGRPDEPEFYDPDTDDWLTVCDGRTVT